jgi:hypothetical protein
MVGLPRLCPSKLKGSDWQSDKPGLRRVIRPGDLPKPGTTPSVANFPHVIQRPPNAVPQGPAGFKVELFADGLTGRESFASLPAANLHRRDARGQGEGSAGGRRRLNALRK